MTPSPAPAPGDPFYLLLAAHDEACQKGQTSLAAASVDVPAEMQPRWQEAVRSLELLAAARAPAAPPTCPLPQQIGRYPVLGLLGEGGMGRVYRAVDTQLQRHVAIKQARSAAGGSTGCTGGQRFRREGRAAAAIRHPNVCPVYDVGEHDGVAYVVMALVEGESLEKRLGTAGRFEDCRQAVELVRQAAEGLAAVHANGVIHRDVKPGNILIDRAGQAVLTDFGLCRPEADDEELTDLGAQVGTPAYMSPEQAAPGGEALDLRTDLYSLGVVLYRMLTGKLPFTGRPPLLRQRSAHESPAVPSVDRPDLDPALEAVVLKAMARRRADRYQSARAFSDALTGWLADGATVDHGAGSGLDTATWSSPAAPVPAKANGRPRRWVLPGVVAAGVLLLLVGAWLVVWSLLR